MAYWVVAFELLQECGLLRDHVASGKVVLGVNHTVRAFQTQRTKDLDLVVAQPAASVERPAGQSFSELADRWRVDLSSQERFLSRIRTSTTSGQADRPRVRGQLRAPELGVCSVQAKLTRAGTWAA